MKIERILNIAILAAILLLVFYVQRACNYYDQVSELKGQYDTLKAEQAKEAVLAIQEIRALQAVIEARDVKIGELQQRITRHKKHIQQADIRLAELEGLEIKIEDKDELILNLRTQITIWRDKFSLAEKIIQEKDDIIFSLTEKYEAQFRISNEYKGLWERSQGLQQLGEFRIKGLEKDIKKSRAGSRIKNILIAGGITYFMYIHVKGMK